MKRKLFLLLVLITGSLGAWADTWYDHWTSSHFQTPAGNIPAKVTELAGSATIMSREGILSFASAGTYTVTFNYTSGNHRLDIKGVDVLTYGNKVIASDYHAGYTGTYQSNKVYTLVIPSEGRYKVRYYITQPNNFSSNGNIVWSPEVTSTEETVDATGKFTTWTYHTASSGAWYGKCASNTTPSVVIEQDGTADVVGLSTSNSVKRPWIKAGYTYNITPALPDGKVITGYTLTTQSTSASYSGTYTYTTNTGTATSAAQAVNTNNTVSVSGLRTDKITITVNGSAGANNYGILITGLTITYDDTAARMYKLKHNNSSLYLSLNETDGFNGSDNSKNAATFATTGTDFLISESGDNYVFKTASGKTLCAAANGKHWNFSNTTDGASNTTWKLTEVDGGVTIQTVSGNAANKYVGADNYAEGLFIFTDKQTQDVWTLEPEQENVATITFQYVYDGNVVKTIEKGYVINGTYDAPDITGYNITATSGTVTGNATVEVPCTPLIPYANVYIANDNDTKLQASDENGTLTFANVGNRIQEKYIWKVNITADGYYTFQNLATGKYMAHKAIQDDAYNFELEQGLVAGNYALKSVAANTHLCIKYDGTLDQASGTFNKTNTNYSTDFIFDEAVINTLTINTTPAVTGVFTWNGETKRGSTVTFSKIAGQTVTSTAVTVTENGYNVTLSANEWDGESDQTITATVSPTFFSADIENAKWVSINNVRNGNYYIYADDEEALHSHQITGDENELFALVGNANSFRLYSKTKQAYFGAANDSQNTPVVANGTNNTYKLVAKTGEYAGYAIVPTGNEGQSLNMHGGAGHDIKYFSAGDGGATWNVSEVVRHNITIALDSENPHANNYQIAKLSVSYDGKTSTSYITKEDVGTKSIYLPTGMEPTLSVDYQYHGYTNTIDGTTVTFAYDGTNYQYLWYEHPDYQFYRIPAIVTNRNGEMIALSDYRYCHNDIGFGRVDQYMRRSADNGKTWTEPELVVAGTDNTPEDAFYKGFGDPALCADRESDSVILMTVAGNNFYGNNNTNYWNGKPNYFARLYSYDGGHTWSEPENITEQIYKLFAQESSDANAVAAAFVGSGKIFQSRVTKVGEYYRLYAALCARPNGNRVIYSDDFGQTWNVLGGAGARPAPDGDEPKCEELPDGSVILSSRKYNGRFFNIYNYTDVATGAGSWNGAIASNNATNGISVGGNSTNGEIMIVRAKKANDDKIYTVALQSLPFGSNRSQVGLWWKDITETSSYQSNGVNTSSVFASNWTRGLQVEDVKTNGYSAYSTFTLQADGKIGFFYEESPGTYAMVYIPLTIGEITKGAYSEIIANVGELAHADNSTKQNPVLEGEVPSPEAVVSTIDETAASIDLTNTTVNGTTVDAVVEAVVAKTGNANTVVYAPSGSETTKNNVVVDGTCASLVLTDKMPFSAPNEFTASNAVYTRTMANKWGTICLPYAVTSNENEAYYTIDRIEDGKLIINQVEGLEAGQPGLVQKFAGDGIAPAATSVEVVGTKNDQTLVDGTVTMIGSFANDTKVTDENAFYIKDNKFWQRAEASEQIADPCFYIDAFRAYFKVEPAANQSRIMSIVVNGDEATGIDALEIAEALSGKEGKFLQNGRVVIVKDNRQYTTAGQRLK
ncbi:MAG: exo-alpha-sialidase [Bacteroidaceae bacterium]|nr:exo-alpha-sialidase [Bacteroidaceae bacterium]